MPREFDQPSFRGLPWTSSRMASSIRRREPATQDDSGLECTI